MGLSWGLEGLGFRPGFWGSRASYKEGFLILPFPSRGFKISVRVSFGVRIHASLGGLFFSVFLCKGS